MRDASVFVTGGGGGIGRAVALASARLGAKVAVSDLNADAAADVAKEAAAAGSPQTVDVWCDVSSQDSVREAYDEASDAIGVPNRVFANAGIEINAPVDELALESWRSVLEVNLMGVFLTCREGMRRLIDTGSGGSIVCTSSPAAFVGFAGGGNSAYAASKGGVSAFVRAAALDCAPHRIRINAVVPGATDTAMLLTGVPAAEREARSDRIRTLARDQIPLGRLAHADEIAAAVVWLLSDASSYVTGSNLVCDGGLMAKSANTF